MKSYSKEELCLIWFDSFFGLENKHKQELYRYVKDSNDIKAVIERGKEYIVQNCGDNVFDTIVRSTNNEYLKSILTALKENRVEVITILSENYPSVLKEIPCPPLVLYAMGDVSLLHDECFGIVGSRKSLPFSINLTETFVEEISKYFVLVTGIAEGVDAKVIETGLKNKAKIISVVAGGFNHIYPKTHTNLFEEVVKSGLAISEHPPYVSPKRYYFPVRNRIIAGLSKGVLVMSGAIKSGTMYTAGYAMEYGKDVFAIPYNVGVSLGAGCNELIKMGAMLADSPKDILSFYGKETAEEKVEFSEEERCIAGLLKDGEQHVDKICEVLKKEIYEIMPTLSLLEIKGVIAKSGVNIYSLTRNCSEE